MNVSIHFNSNNKLTPMRLVNSVMISTGLTPADLENPLKRITLNQEMIIAERFIALVNIPWIGLEVGKEYSFSANGKKLHIQK